MGGMGGVPGSPEKDKALSSASKLFPSLGQAQAYDTQPRQTRGPAFLHPARGSKGQLYRSQASHAALKQRGAGVGYESQDRVQSPLCHCDAFTKLLPLSETRFLIKKALVISVPPSGLYALTMKRHKTVSQCRVAPE